MKALAIALLLSCALTQAQQRVVVTKLDLIRMTETGLPVSLIVKTIESADQTPTLQPEDLVELAKLGVAPEVLEAVVERKGPPGVAGPRPEAPPEPPTVQEPAGEPESADAPEEEIDVLPETPRAGPESFRKVRVTAQMKTKRRFFGVIAASNASLPVYWGVAVADEQGRLRPVRGCAREPACWCSTADGESTCAKRGDPAWDRRFSCFQAIEMTPGETVEVLNLEPPADAAEIRLYAFFMARERSGAIFLEPFVSESGAAYLSIRPRGSQDYSAEAHLALEVGRGADTDLALAVRRFDDRKRDFVPAPDYVELAAVPYDFIPNVCVGR